MATKKSKQFVLNDENTINSFGFRVMTAGIDLGAFKKNPVMLFNHRSWGENYTGPIGRWEGMKKTDGQLLGDSIFDTDDKQGGEICRKVDEDFIKGCSIGFKIIETSVDPNYLLPGQTYPTVTKCKLIEASVCDIPSNENSLALYDDFGNVTILTSADQLETLSIRGLQKLNEQTDIQENIMKYPIALLSLLSLAADATEAQVIEAVTQLKNTNVTLSAEKQNLQALIDNHTEERVKLFVDGLISAGKAPEAQRESITKLAKVDLKAAEEAFSGVKAPIKPTQMINLGGAKKSEGGDPNDRDNWTFDDWSKKDSAGLMKLKASDPDTYKKLLEDQKEANRSKVKMA